MIGLLYTLVTGKPWITVRSAAVEFGPPPGALYAADLNLYSDAELVAHGDEVLAAVKAGRGRTVPQLDFVR